MGPISLLPVRKPRRFIRPHGCEHFRRPLATRTGPSTTERAGKITGVLPLFLVSNWIVGRCLISTPFADYGGICAEDEESADAWLRTQ